ncbi:MAG: hypothetical protein C0484_02700 [Rhodospirillum sp.]|nr:hypothetical protein [Rhodospirillum sp.]
MDVTNVEAAKPSVRAFSGARRWVATVAASFITAYALDLVATSLGLLVVASGLLSGIGYVEALLLLLASYVFWGSGLWAVIKANWALLQRTGACTNILAKVGHDLAVRLGWSLRWRKLAAYVGNTATELAKEAPYYIGAGGFALFTDSVSAIDAIVFLAGANTGAAIYGFALARGLGYFLARLAKRGIYASFDTEWEPGAYLKEYYSEIEPEERETIAFFVDAMKDADRTQPALVFGVGPTLHHVFLAAEKVSEIHLGEYLPANLQEIERWLGRDPEAHDWRRFVEYTLECEGLDRPAPEEITFREEMTRARITDLLHVDLRAENPLGVENTRQYATVISAYCADSATGDKAEWATYMQRIAGLVQPGGMLLVAALRRSRGYVVGGKTFPSADVDEADLQAVLEPRFGRRNLTIQACKLDGPAGKGYSGVVLACACDRAERGMVALRRAATPPLPALSWARAVRARAEAQP